MATKKGAKPAGLPIAPVKFRKESAEAHQVIYDRINDELDDLVGHLEDLARGVYMYVEVYGAEARVYRREPNLEALKYLMDRAMGRPVARSESGQPGEFSTYEDFIKKAIDSRKTVIPQTPVVLPANTAQIDTGDKAPELDADRAAVMKRLLGHA